MEIRKDDLSGEKIAMLINEHLNSMHDNSPPESVHALNLDGLKKSEITFWSAWEGDELLGCGAIKELDRSHGEIKSMRTASAHLRKGVARHMLAFILKEAKRRGYARVSLETGSPAIPEFDPARKLYEAFGFQYCAPFADYNEDPYSSFMTLEL
ncbi:GNAT family N-acetyltransferase [Paenibacillus sp. NPDC058071]|uniref:GNAT family N-acetyltransferase n=1 Tax=Paenibacillus sp. NPDC058071 TaxID=3346326 RepID=UPI0036DD7E76